MKKKIIIVVLIILIIFLVYKWYNYENFTVSNGDQSTLDFNEETQLANILFANIQKNFNIINQSLTDQIKQNIYNAYLTSQLQPIEQKMTAFLNNVNQYVYIYGKFDDMYWDFKIVDIKIDKSISDYYYIIIKNIIINKIMDELKQNSIVIPDSIKTKYPLGIPNTILSSIIDKYYVINGNTIYMR